MTAAVRLMPAQKPGKSKQDYGTPLGLLDAVAERFGAIEFDLAATAENCVAMPRDQHFGPGSPWSKDALAVDWWEVGHKGNVEGVLWCNPPFARIAPWAAKCRGMKDREGWTLLLAPAAVGSNWFIEHVRDHAYVLELTPRLTFAGETTPYPKDCILACFGFGVRGRDTWRWK